MSDVHHAAQPGVSYVLHERAAEVSLQSSSGTVKKDGYDGSSDSTINASATGDLYATSSSRMLGYYAAVGTKHSPA
jgi:hypothetical protein